MVDAALEIQIHGYKKHTTQEMIPVMPFDPAQHLQMY
jgi:hypothetical protein